MAEFDLVTHVIASYLGSGGSLLGTLAFMTT